MYRTGFDGLKTPIGMAFVIISTVFVLMFIVAGALYMRYEMNKKRQMDRQALGIEEKDPDPTTRP